MPELSRFYGIVIRTFFDDHNPAHFHARYGGDEVAVSISSRYTALSHDGRIEFVLGPILVRAPGGEPPSNSGAPSLGGYSAHGTGANSFAGEQRVHISGADTVVSSGLVASLEAGVLIGPELGGPLSWKSLNRLEPEEFWTSEGRYLAFRLAESDMSANRIRESTIQYGWMRISIDTSANVEYGACPVLLHEFEMGPPGVTLMTGEKL